MGEGFMKKLLLFLILAIAFALLWFGYWIHAIVFLICVAALSITIGGSVPDDDVDEIMKRK